VSARARSLGLNALQGSLTLSPEAAFMFGYGVDPTVIGGLIQEALGLASLTISLAETAQAMDAALWQAGMSDTARERAALEDAALWQAGMSDTARERAALEDEPL
jgi:hypothetical protein